MKQNYTHISVVLDRSGSMASVVDDTIGGFNSFLEEQKKVEGLGTLTLVQFDNVYEVVNNFIDLKQIRPLTRETFQPRGSTALLDAIGRTINETGRRLGELAERERPDKVVFVILTDGEENSSREFNNQQINDSITHQRDVYKWEFVFLGANQDAISTASQMGISTQNAMTYAANSAGTQAAFSAVSRNLAGYRMNAAPSSAFAAEDYEAQKKAGVK